MQIPITKLKEIARGQEGFREAQDLKYKSLMDSISYKNQGQIFLRNVFWQKIINGVKQFRP
jgi:hypothetical protein